MCAHERKWPATTACTAALTGYMSSIFRDIDWGIFKQQAICSLLVGNSNAKLLGQMIGRDLKQLSGPLRRSYGNCIPVVNCDYFKAVWHKELLRWGRGISVEIPSQI